MKSKKNSSNSDDLWMEKTESSNESDSYSEASRSISSSSDSEFNKKYNSKSKILKNKYSSEKEETPSEPSLESSLSSESDSIVDQSFQLEPDTVSESSTTSANEYEFVSESSVDSDIDSNLSISSTGEELEKIIGINQPTFDGSFIPLMFYVKYKNKSYRSCEWIDEETLTRTKKGKMIHSIFLKNQTPFRPVHFFNQTVFSEEEFKLYKPAKVEFDEGYVTPEKIISTQFVKGIKEFLIKWISLDITESTWETDVSEDLINKYEECNAFTHMSCYDHSVNQNVRDFDEIKESPIFKNENVLADYQVIGLNWLQYCWFKRVNSILADEMGLGKTIESISIIDSLSKWYPNWGPFLIVCPLSTISNWLIELENWTDFRVVCMMGSQDSLNMIKKYLIYHHIDEKGKLDKERIIFDVILISYENLSREINFISKFNFMYTIIDEAQRIKNFKTIIYQDCMLIRSYHKLLMTGTPIQNNLYEIWSLLHYVDPINFTDFDVFKFIYNLKSDPEAIEKIQMVIRPYILRRKKNDVNIELPEKEETIIEVEMTQIQRSFSQLIFKNNLGTFKDILASKVNLNNIMMQLRKLFCHPFLISKLEDICYSKYKKTHGIPKSEKLTPEQEIESLILASGKTILIDKLLPKLKEGKHKVLIFSQMTKMLDIIEDYLISRDYLYERLDGSCSIANRTLSINRFQNDENVFVFLLSTRAGGLGINLTGADTVIIYDGDWNPQNDIQAQARCHRIGQTKKVNVYRLITRGCYESEMFFRASQKLALDFAILDSNPNVSLDLFDSNGQLSEKELKMKTRMELQTILRKGAYYTFNDDPNEIDKFCSENIDQILDHRSHTRKDLISGGNSRFSKVSFDAETNEAEINKNDFWNKLVGEESSSDDDYDDDDFSFDSGIKTRKKKKTPKSKEKEKLKVILSSLSSSSSSSSSNSNYSSRASSPSSHSSSYSSYSYYSASDNEFNPLTSGKSLNKYEEEEEEDILSAAPDEYDYSEVIEYDDDDIIEVNPLSSSTKKKKSLSKSIALNQQLNQGSIQLMNALASNINIAPQSQPFIIPIPNPFISNVNLNLNTNSNVYNNSNLMANFSMYLSKLLNTQAQINQNQTPQNLNSNNINTGLKSINDNDDDDSILGNPDDFQSVKNPIPSVLIDSIKKFNKSIDHKIYEASFNCIKKHGIGGSRFFISEFMQEIGKNLFVFAYLRLSPEESQKYSNEFNQYIPNIPNQVLKTPYLDFIDEKFLSSLFKGKELEFIIETIKKDELYKAALFVSNEKLPEKYQFAPEMNTPIGWTPIDDFIIITSSPFMEQISDIIKDEKLPFNKIAKDFPSLNEWIPNRLEFLIKEISLLIPKNFSIYEKINGEMIFKKIGNIEKFKELNNHVVYPQQLSINFQKKLLRLFYLYGIPKKNGIKKIINILKSELLFNEENKDLILIFAFKILIKAMKYKPDLSILLKSLKNPDYYNIYNNNKRVDIRWIKEEAIQELASNLDLIFKVRENFNANLDLNGLPDWTEIKEKNDWWNFKHDEILFKTTAYYGFLFNSMLCKFISSKEIDDKTTVSWRNEEVFLLTPIIHPKMNCFEYVFSLDKKKERINQILNFIKCQKSA